MINKKFNRYQSKLENFYFPNYGENFDTSYLYNGYVKCKLLHSKTDTIVFPDQIILSEDEEDFKWIQPLTFLVNLLIKDNSVIHCGFYVDISAGNTLKIEFTNNDLIKNLDDNSSLFKCKIFGPKNLSQYSTGAGMFINMVPYLYLYHHTLPKSKKLIMDSSQLKLSKWNIQGTKTLNNIGYFYLTALDSISTSGDLKQIAMSSDGAIHLLLDNFPQPLELSKNNKENIKNGILEIEVYRENTNNRKATIKFLVDSTIISPKHLWKHFPKNQAVFYEVCMPFIFRIGGEPDKLLTFKNSQIERQENIKSFNYQVVGNATKFTGLEAPYDEENTKEIFKIENLDDSKNILEFWFDNTNSDQYSGKIIEYQKFEKTPPNTI